jgi:hypothetical protein
MESFGPQASSMNNTIHRIPKIMQVLYWFAVLFFAIMAVGTAWVALNPGFAHERADIWYVFIIDGVGAIFGLFLFSASLGVNMVSSSDGLEYHSTGLHIRSSWENMEKVKLTGAFAQWGLGAEVIALSKPAEVLSISWYRDLLPFPNNAIPLVEFGQWRHNSLGAEIKKYAPKLLG